MLVALRCGTFIVLVPWLGIGYLWAVGASACGDDCAWWWTSPIVGFVLLLLPLLVLVVAVIETAVALIRQLARWMT